MTAFHHITKQEPCQGGSGRGAPVAGGFGSLLPDRRDRVTGATPRRAHAQRGRNICGLSATISAACLSRTGLAGFVHAVDQRIEPLSAHAVLGNRGRRLHRLAPG